VARRGGSACSGGAWNVALCNLSIRVGVRADQIEVPENASLDFELETA
jgi:hypothetical protein